MIPEPWGRECDIYFSSRVKIKKAVKCEKEREGDAAATEAHQISGPAVRGLAAGSRAPGISPERKQN